MLKRAVRRLEKRTEAGRRQFADDFAHFADRHGLIGWEGWFSPYDDQVYEVVLAHIDPEDVVLEIGAGDLRLALRLTEKAQRVTAVEVNPLILAHALDIVGLDLPRNLHVVCANALDFPILPDVTAAILLMRHCHHFQLYADRLQAGGCQTLITNARWKAGVEAIDLTSPGKPFEAVEEGWYACRCGSTGYVGEGTRPDMPPTEVKQCPACVRHASDGNPQSQEEADR